MGIYIQMNPAAEAWNSFFRRLSFYIQKPYAVERCKPCASAKSEIISAVIHEFLYFINAFTTKGFKFIRCPASGDKEHRIIFQASFLYVLRADEFKKQAICFQGFISHQPPQK